MQYLNLRVISRADIHPAPAQAPPQTSEAFFPHLSAPQTRNPHQCTVRPLAGKRISESIYL